MARAHSIHIVLFKERPIAAFTVRWECLEWLTRNDLLGKENVEVLKLRDGDRDATAMQLVQQILH
jgi:hypothetical protein